jgi:alpha-1,2-mannosyltransferase
MIHDLELTDYVEIRLSLPFGEVKKILAGAAVGVHTMIDEHFGISIVEMLAAGLVVIAHNSAGPKEDILVGDSKEFGFLAESLDDYSELFERAIKDFIDKDKRDDQIKMIEAGQDWCLRNFTNESCEKNVLSCIKKLLFV